MHNENITHIKVDETFKKQMERVTLLIASVEHPKRLFTDFSSSFIHPEFLALVSYSYVLSIAYDAPTLDDATLEQVFTLSDSYNSIISEYIRRYINESAFDSIKNTLIEEEIARDVLVHLVRERCDSSVISTPNSVVELALALLDIRAGESVCEIGSGVGGFAITAAERNPEARFTGFEINSGAFLISLMRNYLERGEKHDTLKILQKDAFDLAKTEDRTRFDKVFSNYPLSMRFQFSGIGQTYYGTVQDRLEKPSLSHSGDWVFNMLIWDLMKDSPSSKGLGIMTGGSSWNLTSKVMRKHFLDHGMVESVIVLPQKLFGSESTPVMMIVFSHNNEHVRMVDASSLYHAGRRQNELEKKHINQIITDLATDSKNSRLVSYQEIEAEDFTLDPGRYLKQVVDIEHGAPFETVIRNITRGAQVPAREMDKLVSHKATNIKYLRLANIKNGFIEDELHSLMSLDPALERYCVKENNLILSKNGYPYKVAIAYPKPGQQILATGNLYIIELDQSKIHPIYLKAFLESETGIKQLKSITVGASVPNIGIGALRKMQIPVPPMEEQLVIVKKYQKQLDEIVALKVALEASFANLQEITSAL